MFIHYCAHCGERAKGKYCKTCQTAEGRAKITTEQKALEAEREKSK